MSRFVEEIVGRQVLGGLIKEACCIYDCVGNTRLRT